MRTLRSGLRAARQKISSLDKVQRVTNHDRAVILVVLSCIVFLVTTTAWLMWSVISPENAQQRRNQLFVTCYTLYGLVDVFCLGVLLHEIPRVRLMWRRLKLLRYDLYVLPYNETTDRPDQVHDMAEQTSSTPVRSNQSLVAESTLIVQTVL